MRQLNSIVALIAAVVIVSAIPSLGAEGTAPLPAKPVLERPALDAPVPMTDIHDILPPVPVGTDLSWLAPALLAVGAILIVAGLWWWWRKRRKGPTPETIVPELPPEMIAMRALDGIGDVRGMDGKRFYFRLSAVLRRYILGRFAIGAPEMTTEEFLPSIDKLAIDGDLTRRLKRLSRAMDPVKFGGQTAVERQMAADLAFARQFVRETTPSVD